MPYTIAPQATGSCWLKPPSLRGLGYEHSSLDSLMKGMGIARQSLYGTFGDKRSI
jgi:hypothetical protein